MRNFRPLRNAALLLTLAVVAPGQQPNRLAIRAAHLIDGVSAAPISNAVVLIEDSRIKAVGQNLPVPAGTRIIDLGQGTVLPGLIDTHTHLLSNQNNALGGLGTNLLFEVAQLSTAKRALLGASLALEDLQAGITTVRDLGNSGRNGDVALRDAIQQGWVTGPRMLVSTRALAPAGGQFGSLIPEAQGIIDQEYAVINGPDEARRAVRQAVYDGADCIKVIVQAGSRMLSLEEVGAIVQEAHRLSRRVAAHASGDQPTRIAAQAGVDSIEHAYTVPDDVLHMMSQKHIFLVPTDSVLETYAALEFNGRHPTTQERLDYETNVRPFIVASRERLKRAVAAGVPIASGSDMYIIYPGKTRGEASVPMFRAYVEAGMEPLDVIRAGTRKAAELLGIQGEVGTLEPGKLADMIAVSNDPLGDIAELEHVRFVLKAGRVIRNDLQPK